MKACLRKTDEAIWDRPLSKRTPLSTNPPISEQIFHNPLLCLNFRNKKPPPLPSPLILGNYAKKLRKSLVLNCLCLFGFTHLDLKSSL